MKSNRNGPISELEEAAHETPLLAIVHCKVPIVSEFLNVQKFKGDDEMGVPKTPKEFDYDLWTAGNGAYMVRVKSTGEICEVDIETMRFLRAEEKRLRRAMNKSSQSDKEIVKEPILSLDCLKQNDGNSLFPDCLGGQDDPAEIVVANILVEHFLADLTSIQLDVYKNCILAGKNYAEYARELGLTRQYIHKCIVTIRKKAKIFLDLVDNR